MAGGFVFFFVFYRDVGLHLYHGTCGGGPWIELRAREEGATSAMVTGSEEPSWEYPFSGTPPQHPELYRFLEQEELLTGCTVQHIGQEYQGDRPRRGLTKWLAGVDWLESYQQLDEDNVLWDMVRVKYEIVACWAKVPVFRWRSDTKSRPPDAPPPSWIQSKGRTNKSSGSKRRKKKHKVEPTTAGSDRTDHRRNPVKDETDSDTDD